MPAAWRLPAKRRGADRSFSVNNGPDPLDRPAWARREIGGRAIAARAPPGRRPDRSFSVNNGPDPLDQPAWARRGSGGGQIAARAPPSRRRPDRSFPVDNGAPRRSAGACSRAGPARGTGGVGGRGGEMGAEHGLDAATAPEPFLARHGGHDRLARGRTNLRLMMRPSNRARTEPRCDYAPTIASRLRSCTAAARRSAQQSNRAALRGFALSATGKPSTQ